jgi:hypothetical protein
VSDRERESHSEEPTTKRGRAWEFDSRGPVVSLQLELKLIHTQMAQKSMLRAEVHAHALCASQNVKRAEVWVMRLDAKQVKIVSREWTREALKPQSGRVTSCSPGHTLTGKIRNTK